MCVAAIIYGRVSLADLQSMERTNRDGAGVAWLDHATGRVVYRRGLRAHEVHEILQSPECTRPALVHFRYATVGDERANLCHPFPLGEEALREEAHGSTERGVLIHNGTWRDWAWFVPDHAHGRDLSDTQVAAYVAGYWEGVLDDVSWATAIARPERALDGALHLAITERGTWYDHDGNRYSNLSWCDSGRVWWRGVGGEWVMDDDYTAPWYGMGKSYASQGEALVRASGVRIVTPGNGTKREGRKARKRRERREARLALIAARSRDADPSATARMTRALAGCEPPWISERTRALCTDETELSSWDERVWDGDTTPTVADACRVADAGDSDSWEARDSVQAWLDADRDAIEALLADDLGGSD